MLDEKHLHLKRFWLEYDIWVCNITLHKLKTKHEIENDLPGLSIDAHSWCRANKSGQNAKNSRHHSKANVLIKNWRHHFSLFVLLLVLFLGGLTAARIAILALSTSMSMAISKSYSTLVFLAGFVTKFLVFVQAAPWHLCVNLLVLAFRFLTFFDKMSTDRGRLFYSKLGRNVCQLSAVCFSKKAANRISSVAAAEASNESLKSLFGIFDLVRLTNFFLLLFRKE